MPTPTYTLIDSVTLGSSASSVTFSSIDQTYGDLVLSTQANTSVLLRVNGDSGANYSFVYMYGSSGGTGSAASTGGTLANIGTNGLAEINDYSATDKHKTIISRYNLSTFVEARATRWESTAAITSLLLYTGSSFNAGSTFFLYGIAKAL
jgi:hypothetical protein